MKIKRESSISAKILTNDIVKALGKKDKEEKPKIDLGKLAAELADRKILSAKEDNE